MTTHIFPIFKGVRATSILRAFILNAICIAIIAVFTVEVKDVIDEYEKNIRYKSLRVFILFLLSLMIALMSYGVMWILFGFGGGMIASTK